MQNTSQSTMTMKLEDFGELQTRYASMKIGARAAAVLEYADAALQTAERILKTLSSDANSKQAFNNIRKNALLLGKMRPSEAKALLMDGNDDFLGGTSRKLAAWRKTMERISQGESIAKEKDHEFIPSDAPLAMAIAGCYGISNYISIVQLALGELAKIDTKNADSYKSSITEIRRAATVLSDCEHASGIDKLVH